MTGWRLVNGLQVVGTFTQLEGLWLGDNQLTGTIPDLSPLIQLKYLDLAGNQLIGEIPPYLGTFTQLEGLWLGNNQLTDGIPDLSALTQLQTLWLENNRLEGEFPAGITKLTALTAASLGHNMLWTNDPAVDTFLNTKNPGWATTQTIPPSNVAVGSLATNSIEVTWTAIPYTADGGYYEVGYGETARGPYAVGCTTPDKSTTGCTVTGLTPNTTYYLVVRTFTPAHGAQQNDLLSPYSTEVSTATLADEDTDGIGDGVEDGAPNGGDGNGDGIPDSLQVNVTSLPNAADGQYLTLVAPPEGQLADVIAIADPSPGTMPTDVEFAVGFISYEVQGLAPGGTATVTLILPPGATMNTYYKYGPTLDNPTPHWYGFLYNGSTGAEFSGTTVVLHFVDGLRGDHDLLANGVIVDPGAPGIFYCPNRFDCHSSLTDAN